MERNRAWGEMHMLSSGCALPCLQAGGVGRAHSWTPVSEMTCVCTCLVHALTRNYPDDPFSFLESSFIWFPGWS